jgi:hypothetical protein
MDPDESDLADVLKYLIDIERLEPVQAGVARCVIDRGEDDLAARQTTVLNGIRRESFVDECARCAIPVPLCNDRRAMDNGVCGYCEHMKQERLISHGKPDFHHQTRGV